MSFEQKIQLIQLIILLISSVAIPLTIFLVGNKIVNTRQIEEKLRNDRIEIYNKVLEPFLLLFTTEAIIKASLKLKPDQVKTGADLATEKILTLSYQEYSFKLNLLGSDKVVRAYNNLMQAFFNLKGKDQEKRFELI